jgi:hypothetical protein
MLTTTITAASSAAGHLPTSSGGVGGAGQQGCDAFGLAGRLCRGSLAILLAVFSMASAGGVEPTGYRRLAPGVLTVIPADRSGDDALLRADIPEITEGLVDLTWEPKQADATAISPATSGVSSSPSSHRGRSTSTFRPATCACSASGSGISSIA